MDKYAAFEAGVEAALEKTAMTSGQMALGRAGVQLGTQAIGGAVGHHYGKAQKERGEKYHFGGKQLAGALLLPGGLGYQIGRRIAHGKKKPPPKVPQQVKTEAAPAAEKKG